VRLATGLVLVTFVATHLLNHALGLISLDAMEAGRVWFLALWRHPIPTAALYGSLLTHLALALVSILRRRTLRMPAWEAAQILLGLAVPALLAPHVVGTRLTSAWFGTQDSYTRIAFFFWQARPDLGLRQTALVVLAWAHGCVGLHYWLRLRPGYAAAAPYLLAAAVLLPALSLLGFVQGGREAAARAAAAGGLGALTGGRMLTAAEQATQAAVTNTVWAVFGAGLAGVLAARWVRAHARARQTFQVAFPGGRRARAPVGTSVLEVSRLSGVPHASVCGGRGRCSTCRVRVVRGLEHLVPAAVEEQRVLDRVGAPPNVRLACQLRPAHDVSVVPVLSASAPPSEALPQPGHRAGQEREVAILFADLRRFTALAEHRLPYDVVFLLNRYFEAVGSAVERAGGVVNQFTGDGVMALFGIETGPAAGSRAALGAAANIVQGLAALSRDLADELAAPLRIGIGIHAGPAVVGRMGHGEARYLTAVGDTVHVASRLQDLTKQYDCQLIVSEPAAAGAGLDVSALDRHELGVRNRAEPVAIYVVKEVAALDLAGDAHRQ
jgi:adenylate cyclase